MNEYNTTPQASYLYRLVEASDPFTPEWNVAWAQYIRVAYPLYTGIKEDPLSYTSAIAKAADRYAAIHDRINTCDKCGLSKEHHHPLCPDYY